MGWIILVLASLLLGGCGAQAEPPVRIETPGGDPDRGRQQIAEYGCGACHTVPGVTRANATVGPPLGAWAERSSIAGQFPNRPEYLVAWIRNPQALKPGTMMPDTGVTEQGARDISAYLYTLHTNAAQFPWP